MSVYNSRDTSIAPDKLSHNLLLSVVYFIYIQWWYDKLYHDNKGNKDDEKNNEHFENWNK